MTASRAAGDLPLNGRVAVVTGAARGLGQSIALRLAGHGAEVVGFDLGGLDETAEAVKRAGGKLTGRRVDATDAHAVDEAVGEILTKHGRIDVLVNAAGRWIDLRRRPLWEIDVPEFDDVLTVNVRSAFVMVKAVAPAMREARYGRIVNFTSATVSFGMAGLLHYVTAKSALVGMTRSIARELGPFGVTANTVAPGLVATDAGREVNSQEWYDEVVETQMLREPISTDDIAGAVAYLCGPDGRMVTAQTLHVSGGSSIGSM